MKKPVGIICLLGISLCVILALSMCSPATQAVVGLDTINSRWAFSPPPTINGIINPAEWSGATIRNIVFDMRDNSNNHHWYLNATLYVMNNYNNLYIAVKIYNDTYWAQDTRNYWKGLAVYFNANDNGSLGEGENGEIKTTWTGQTFYSENQLYYNTTLGYWDSVINAGGTQVGAIAFTFANSTTPLTGGALGNWTFEMRIPLFDSNSTKFGFHITDSQLPKAVGYKIEFEDSRNQVTGIYPDNGSTPVSQVTDAATFGELIINPLFNLTIAAGPGGTTSPAPGTYQYGYGTIVSVTAIPNAGYVLNYWTLDAVNVGATNPYTVTMDQNHVLEAFFKSAPSPVGGFAFSLSDKASMSSVAGYGAILVIFLAATVVVKRKRK